MVDEMSEMPPATNFNPDLEPHVEGTSRTRRTGLDPDLEQGGGEEGGEKPPHRREREESPEEQADSEARLRRIEREVELANKRLASDEIAVHLRVHRRGGEMVLQIVDERGEAPRHRTFKVIHAEDLERIVRDFTEESGLFFDTQA